MAFFTSANSCLGVDIGTASLKIVELLNRRQRIEVATYGQADLPNLLVSPNAGAAAIKETAAAVTELLARTKAASDSVIAALPSSIVFSAVIPMPNLPDEDMDEAVHFAARDIVPADLEDTVLGWSRLGTRPRMEGEQAAAPASAPAGPASTNETPVFVIAAPKDIVERYKQVMVAAKLNLVALEVETFPLARSLLGSDQDSAMIVDIGDRVTTYHIIDTGAPRVSYSMDFGGFHITSAIAAASHGSEASAEAQKINHGLASGAPADYLSAATAAARKLIDQSQQLIAMYASQHQRTITKTVLIGGGANLKQLDQAWTKVCGHKVTIGNPWRGLSYPQTLENKMRELGPTYAVAVGLAQRQLSRV